MSTLLPGWPRLLARLETTRRQRAASRALRARCTAELRDLSIPTPFDEHTFCALLAERRSRPIELLPLSLRRLTGRETLYGVIIDKPSIDIIAYERDTSRFHRQQIILHEASHLILGHRFSPVLPEELPTLPADVVGNGTVRHALWRRTHATAAEQEAEVLASLILERAAINLPARGHQDDTVVMGALARLAAFYRLRKGA